MNMEGYAFSLREMELCRTFDGNLSHILKKQKQETHDVFSFVNCLFYL